MNYLPSSKFISGENVESISLEEFFARKNESHVSLDRGCSSVSVSEKRPSVELDPDHKFINSEDFGCWAQFHSEDFNRLKYISQQIETAKKRNDCESLDSLEIREAVVIKRLRTSFDELYEGMRKENTIHQREDNQSVTETVKPFEFIKAHDSSPSHEDKHSEKPQPGISDKTASINPLNKELSIKRNR